MALSLPPASACEPRADENESIGRRALLGNERLIDNGVARPAADGRLVRFMPIELAMAFEDGGSGHRSNLLRRQLCQERRFTQVDPQAVLTVQPFNVQTQRIGTPHEIAQALPANLEQ